MKYSSSSISETCHIINIVFSIVGIISSFVSSICFFVFENLVLGFIFLFAGPIVFFSEYITAEMIISILYNLAGIHKEFERFNSNHLVINDTRVNIENDKDNSKKIEGSKSIDIIDVSKKSNNSSKSNELFKEKTDFWEKDIKQKSELSSQTSKKYKTYLIGEIDIDYIRKTIAFGNSIYNLKFIDEIILERKSIIIKFPFEDNYIAITFKTAEEASKTYTRLKTMIFS